MSWPDYRHSDLAKLYGLEEPCKEVEEEEDEEHEDSSTTSSQASQRPHLHQTESITGSGSHRYTYRGGPFGRPPPSALSGIKYSSSLSLGPEIQPPEQQNPASAAPGASSPVASPPAHLSITGPAPTDPDPSGLTSTGLSQTDQSPAGLSPAHLFPTDLPQTGLTSSQTDPNPTQITQITCPSESKPEEDKDMEDKSDHKEVEDDLIKAVESYKESSCTSLEEEKEAKLSPATLQAKLAHSCEVLLTQSSNPVSVPEKRGGKKEPKTKPVEKRAERVRAKKGEKEKRRKRKLGRNREASDVGEGAERARKKQKGKAKSEGQRCPASPPPLSSASGGRSKQLRKSPAVSVENIKPQKKVVEREREKERARGGGKRVKPAEESENKDSNGKACQTQATSKTATKTKAPPSASGSSASLSEAELRRLRASSAVPLKELKILLVKLESNGRQTFVASEIEQNRIPLTEVSIKNTAAEIIEACK